MATVYPYITSQNMYSNTTRRPDRTNVRARNSSGKSRQRLMRLKLRLLSMVLLAELSLCAGFIMGRSSIAPPASKTSYSPDMEHTTIEDIQTYPGQGISADDWNLLLINKDYPLSADFSIPELTQLRNGHAIDARVYPSLQEMMDACRADGLDPLICSSFRTWDRQEELFSNKIASLLAQGYSQSEAEACAAMWVARPGTSEHQAGLAVDIVDTSYQKLNTAQEQTAVQQWLINHCAEYGFILRYPTDKSDITGIGYEPWHYRYVGVEAAQYIMEHSICLEEYLEQISK